MIEHAHTNRQETAEATLRNAPPNIVSAVNRARRMAGLPEIPATTHGHARGGTISVLSNGRWRTIQVPDTDHRHPKQSGHGRDIVRESRVSSRGARIARVLIMPSYMDAPGEYLRRALPETVSRTAFGTAATLNASTAWSLRDGHDGPTFDYAGPRLRAIDTPHGLVIEWRPDLNFSWSRDALHAIEAGNSAVSLGMRIRERRVSHLPHPVEVVTRAELGHVALLLRGQQGCYAGGRAKVFRCSWSNDPDELKKQIDELVASCRWHARQSGARC